jgi:hypothetical protein
MSRHSKTHGSDRVGLASEAALHGTQRGPRNILDAIEAA